MRVDLFLKTCHLVKRRTVAREMCETGRILVNGRKTKPSKELKPGDRVALYFTMKSIELDVLDLPERKSVQKVELQDLYRVIPK